MPFLLLYLVYSANDTIEISISKCSQKNHTNGVCANLSERISHLFQERTHIEKVDGVPASLRSSLTPKNVDFRKVFFVKSNGCPPKMDSQAFKMFGD